MNRLIRDTIWWWKRRHSPLAAVPEWRKAKEAEKRAQATGCTQSIGRARKDLYKATHSALRGRG